jgi:hypothetical protein
MRHFAAAFPSPRSCESLATDTSASEALAP